MLVLRFSRLHRHSLPTRVPVAWCTWKVRIPSYIVYGYSLKTFSGKTSLIHSLAGELGLDIYVVSLSSKG
jgi:hypothetical protein